jgi:hypothetical protein
VVGVNNMATQKFGDILSFLDGVKTRQQGSKQLLEGLQTVQDQVQNWAMGMGPTELDAVLGKRMIGPQAGPKGLPTKAGGAPAPTPAPDAGGTFPVLDKVLDPIEKLGTGVKRGLTAALSPVTAVLDVLSAPSGKALEMQLASRERLGGLEAETGIEQAKIEQIGETGRAFVEHEHEKELQRQKATADEELQRQKDVAALERKNIEEKGKDERAKMLIQGRKDIAAMRSRGQTWGEIFKEAFRLKEEGNDAMWQAYIESKKAGKEGMWEVIGELAGAGGGIANNPDPLKLGVE